MRKETSTNNQNRQALEEFCGMVYTYNLISGRWKMLILYKLEKGSMRYHQLKQKMPNITERMLTLQLKELEKDGLVTRTVHPDVPVQVSYALTESAKLLSPVWHAMEKWGDARRQQDKTKPLIAT